MRNKVQSVTLVLVGVAAAVTLSACADSGDLSIVNNGPDDVWVDTGDEEFTVAEDGGVVLLNYGCTPGDVTVRFSTGTEVEVPGPVCPEQEIVVEDETATLRPAPEAAATGS